MSRRLPRSASTIPKHRASGRRSRGPDSRPSSFGPRRCPKRSRGRGAENVTGIAMAYEWLIERPSVDAARCGLLRTCMGGSFAPMAAADLSIRDRVAFVVA